MRNASWVRTPLHAFTNNKSNIVLLIVNDTIYISYIKPFQYLIAIIISDTQYKSSDGYNNDVINSLTFGPNVDTLRLVIPYITGTEAYKQSTLKGRNPNVNFIANVQSANPINALNFLGGNAMNVWLLPTNITPQPDWSNAFITSYDIFMDANEDNKLEEVITGQIAGGNGFVKALFTPNVDHVVFKGYFDGSASVNTWRWPPT